MNGEQLPGWQYRDENGDIQCWPHENLHYHEGEYVSPEGVRVSGKIVMCWLPHAKAQP